MAEPPPDPNAQSPPDPNGRPLPQMPTTPMVGPHFVYAPHPASAVKVGPPSSSQTVYQGQPYHHQPAGTQLFLDQQQQHATVPSTPTAHPISGHQVAPSPFNQVAFSNSRQHNLPSHHRRQLSHPDWAYMNQVYQDHYSQPYPPQQQQQQYLHRQQQHPHPSQQQHHPQQQQQYHRQQQREQHQYAHDYFPLLGTPSRPHRQAQPQQAPPPLEDATTDTTTTKESATIASCLDPDLVTQYKYKKGFVNNLTLVGKTEAGSGERTAALVPVNAIKEAAKTCADRLSDDIKKNEQDIETLDRKCVSKKAKKEGAYDRRKAELEEKLAILKKDHEDDIKLIDKNHARKKEDLTKRVEVEKHCLSFANSLVKCADMSEKKIPPMSLTPDWHKAPYMVAAAILQTPGHKNWGSLGYAYYLGFHSKADFDNATTEEQLAILDAIHQVEPMKSKNFRKDRNMMVEAGIIAPEYKLGQYRYNYNPDTIEFHFRASLGYYILYGDADYNALGALPEKDRDLANHKPFKENSLVDTPMTERILKVCKMKDSGYEIPDTSLFDRGFPYFNPPVATTSASATTDSALEPTAGSNDKLTTATVTASESWSSGGTSGVSEIASTVDESKTAPAVGEIEPKQPPSSLVSGPGTPDTPPTPAGPPPPEPAPTGGRYKLPDDDEESSISDSTPPPAMNDDTDPAVMASNGAGAGEEDPSAEAAKQNELLARYLEGDNFLLDFKTVSSHDLQMAELHTYVLAFYPKADFISQVQKWYLERLVDGYCQTHPNHTLMPDGCPEFHDWAIPSCKNCFFSHLSDEELDRQLRDFWLDVDL